MTTDILSISYALDDALAIISLHHEPVNSMNTAFWTALLTTLSELEANPKVRGIVFASTLQRNVFTAGYDLDELHAPRTSLERYINFWVISNTFLARLYTSPLLTIAAVKGACPAGGCCLAMCCDFRIVTQDASMGLNEVAIGLSAPGNWIKVMISIIGQGKADKFTQCGRLVGAVEALKVGLVDMIVSNADALEPATLKLAEDIFESPDPGRRHIKALLRGALGRSWGDRGGLEREARQSWGFLTKEETVKALGVVMSRLLKPRYKSKI